MGEKKRKVINFDEIGAPNDGIDCVYNGKTYVLQTFSGADMDEFYAIDRLAEDEEITLTEAMSKRMAILFRTDEEEFAVIPDVRKAVKLIETAMEELFKMDDRGAKRKKRNR